MENPKAQAAPQMSESLVGDSRHKEFSKVPRVYSNMQSRLRTFWGELVAYGVEAVEWTRLYAVPMV